MKRMRRFWSVLILCFSLTMQNFAYGAVVSDAADREDLGKSVRGELISSVEVSLIDNGRGSLNIYADVLCHQVMKEIRLDLYLDQWNESTNSWSQIRSYEYIWNESNTPAENRYMGVVDFDVSGLARGKSYRLRAMAGATALDGTRSRTWSAETDAVQAQSLE